MNDPNKGVEVPALNPVIANRAAFLEQIADQAEQDNAPGGIDTEELKGYMSQVKATYGEGPETEPAEQDADERSTSSPEPSPASHDEDSAADSSAQDTVALKVDGETIIKPKAEVEEHGGVRAYQMELAAERRLTESKRILEEMKQLRLPAHQPAPEENQSEDDVEALARAIRIGTDDEATEAIRRLKRNTVVDANQIDSMVRNSIESRSDLDWFLSEYKDVQSDPRLFNALREEDEQNWNAGDRRPRRERWKELGEAYRVYIKPSDSLQAKRERKASVVTIPSASVRQQAAQIDEGPENAQDVIAQMRKDRGQA